MTPQQIEAMKMALEALEYALNKPMWNRPKMTVAITALEEALAQPEQEPVISKWVLREVYFDEDGEPISHRSPPQRKPLTDEEIDKLLGPFPRYADEWSMTDFIRFARAIEAAHGIGENT